MNRSILAVAAVVFATGAAGPGLPSSVATVTAGSGIGYYNGYVTIPTSGSGTSWSMSDASRDLSCSRANGAVLTGDDDQWGNGSGRDLETACVDALYAALQLWEMLSQWLGRDGIDGSGNGLPIRIWPDRIGNSFDGSYINIGRTRDGMHFAASMDLVAHEFGHAIFQTTPGGSAGGNETGGINEGGGDIFGALTEHFAGDFNDPPDYVVGEEVDFVGSGPIRVMYDPSLRGHPNCWSTSIPYTEVHAASGPLNHWFYLLAEGSHPEGMPDSPICSNGPGSVTGIGIRKAGTIFMGALMRKTPNWRYGDVRSASLAAVVQLYGTASTECATTKAAWDSVNVPVQPGEPTCATRF